TTLAVTIPPGTTAVTTAFTAQTLSLTATVTATGTGASTPVGAVNFFNGNTLLSTTPVPLDNNGKATFSLRGVPAGPNSLRAVFVPTTAAFNTSAAVVNLQASNRSTIGTFDPTSGNWFLRNDNSAGPFDFGFVFGLPGWRP